MTPRVVLDTNCLVSSLVFTQGKTSWLRQGWQSGLFVPVVCKETVTELLRVFSYPKFHLDRENINHLLADFLPWTETALLLPCQEPIEMLRDRDDAVFLQLARQEKAHWLVSGDRHLLELKNVIDAISIISPVELYRIFEHSLN